MELLNRCYEKNPDFVARKIADEFILVPIRQKVGDLGSIYTLNETAACVWELIDGKHTVADIKKNLLDQFKTTENEVEEDLQTIISQLESIGSIISK